MKIKLFILFFTSVSLLFSSEDQTTREIGHFHSPNVHIQPAYKPEDFESLLEPAYKIIEENLLSSLTQKEKHNTILPRKKFYTCLFLFLKNHQPDPELKYLSLRKFGSDIGKYIKVSHPVYKNIRAAETSAILRIANLLGVKRDEFSKYYLRNDAVNPILKILYAVLNKHKDRFYNEELRNRVIQAAKVATDLMLQEQEEEQAKRGIKRKQPCDPSSEKPTKRFLPHPPAFPPPTARQ